MRRLLKRALELNKTSDVKQKVRNGKYELSMLIQAAVVCGIMGTEIICFYFLLKFAVKLTGKKAEIPTNIFINCYVIFNNFILKLLFNMTKIKRIRTMTPIH
uniref:Uncharacterized protein n=1 Tax=Wuchereria bancrofti TaxID=6293 RepID=A0AAF5PYE1_WUCBA